MSFPRKLKFNFEIVISTSDDGEPMEVIHEIEEEEEKVSGKETTNKEDRSEERNIEKSENSTPTPKPVDSVNGINLDSTNGSATTLGSSKLDTNCDSETPGTSNVTVSSSHQEVVGKDPQLIESWANIIKNAIFPDLDSAYSTENSLIRDHDMESGDECNHTISSQESNLISTPSMMENNNIGSIPDRKTSKRAGENPTSKSAPTTPTVSAGKNLKRDFSEPPKSKIRRESSSTAQKEQEEKDVDELSVSQLSYLQ